MSSFVLDCSEHGSSKGNETDIMAITNVSLSSTVSDTQSDSHLRELCCRHKSLFFVNTRHLVPHTRTQRCEASLSLLQKLGQFPLNARKSALLPVCRRTFWKELHSDLSDVRILVRANRFRNYRRSLTPLMAAGEVRCILYRAVCTYLCSNKTVQIVMWAQLILFLSEARCVVVLDHKAESCGD